ncbi:MAG TPA: CAAX prenyl protease-related protein [Paludibaculum sp.]
MAGEPRSPYSLTASLPWVGPFVVFVVLLAVAPSLGPASRLTLAAWVLIVAVAIFLLSRNVLEFRPARPWASIAIGVAVFAVWVTPDLLFPGWRSSTLFQNSLTGKLATSLGSDAFADPASLALRSLRAILIVPIVEELFWRGWLMRWIERQDFQTVPLGHYHRNSFWLVAVLFAMEHGPYWDVGFLAGAGYNWWMVRTRRLSDLILAHAVTNACLCAFVVVTGRWEFWL